MCKFNRNDDSCIKKVIRLFSLLRIFQLNVPELYPRQESVGSPIPRPTTHLVVCPDCTGRGFSKPELVSSVMYST